MVKLYYYLKNLDCCCAEINPSVSDVNETPVTSNLSTLFTSKAYHKEQAISNAYCDMDTYADISAY